jgi:glycine C-acetyltransferase
MRRWRNSIVSASSGPCRSLTREHCRRRLYANVGYFTSRLCEEGFDIGNSESAIIPVLLKDETIAFEMARQCNEDGVFAMPVAYPAVAKGAERLRMNVTAAHAPENLDYAVQVLLRARAAIAVKR